MKPMVQRLIWPAIFALIAGMVCSAIGVLTTRHFYLEYRRADNLTGGFGLNLFWEAGSFQSWQIRSAAYPSGRTGFILLSIGVLLSLPVFVLTVRRPRGISIVLLALASVLFVAWAWWGVPWLSHHQPPPQWTD